MNQKTSLHIILIILAVFLGYKVFHTKIEPSVTDQNKNKAVLKDVNRRLTIDALKNAEYKREFEDAFKLEDGIYYLPILVAGESKSDWYIELNISDVVFGDLNNDGYEDAVATLKSRAGGTGVFRDLVVIIDQEGTPINVASKYLGDRPQVDSLTIDSGIISLEMTERNYDALEHPERHKSLKYRLSGNDLVEI